jgi:hypothetical protein
MSAMTLITDQIPQRNEMTRCAIGDMPKLDHVLRFAQGRPAFHSADLASDIGRKDCDKAAGRSHFISPEARRMPSMRSALSSGLTQGGL